ncbi:hypothetical protein HS088_TW11G01055 [Tripterygium wilfordii]|uniref:Dolichyl-diphosphooligosaccharide--protein glycosyltransferase subunit 1 n=1 Tax=Tripterygium wilfordii TaxID=458696 RepID=A0A7J7D3S5_TRIWF|nr:hypothetical protein HS088_TW11G01055 [Tripterygium wilfordii]
MGFLQFSLLLFTVALLTSTALSDLILSKVDRRIDLTSQIVRITSTLKVENPDSNPVSEVLVAFPERQAKNLAYLTATLHGGKGKAKTSAATLPVEVANPEGKPQGLNFYSVSLQKELVKGDSLTLDVLAVFSQALQPFPEKITQAEVQLGLFQESAHYLSPYVVKVVLPEGSRDIAVSSPFPVKQSEEVQAAVQQVDSIIYRCLTLHEKLESSLRNLSRTGDVQACKAARKTADASLKELSKELKPLMAFLQSSPAASQLLPKVEELVAKERELQERLMTKHSAVVDGYEKKSGGRDIENRVAAQQQKIAALRQELEDILEFIDEI